MQQFIKHSLSQLEDVLSQFSVEDYQSPLSVLYKNSIGQHTRHIIEFYQCLFLAIDSDYLCYDERKRNKRLESDPKEAIKAIKTILSFELPEVDTRVMVKSLIGQDDYILSESTFGREIVYVNDHTIHHFALIKVALEQVYNEVEYDNTFGYAPSTIDYNATHNKE